MHSSKGPFYSFVHRTFKIENALFSFSSIEMSPSFRHTWSGGSVYAWGGKDKKFEFDRNLIFKLQTFRFN